jgi:hypothetical protein
MTRTYSAILRGDDRLEWTDASPTPEVRGRTVRVEIAVEDEIDKAGQGRRMTGASRKLAANNASAEIEDPAAREREIRVDRPFAGSPCWLPLKITLRVYPCGNGVAVAESPTSAIFMG